MNVAQDPDICKKCRLDKLAGAHKIFNEVYGRPIMIVGQSPSQEENDATEFLHSTSPAGKFIWRALALEGLQREDCDVTAAVRCIAAESVVGSYSVNLRPRAPSKEEIKQCSSYTKSLVQLAIKGEEQAAGGTRAILVLGQLAAKQLLGGEWRKDRRIIDSAKYGVRVFCVDHPGFFLRSGIKGLNEDDERLKAFRQTIKAMAEFIASGAVTMNAIDYLRTQHYRIVRTGEKAWRFARKLKAWAIEKNERLSVDVEDDVPDDLAETGNEISTHEILSVAVCPKPGHSVMFVVDHPDALPGERNEIVAALHWLLSDPAVQLTKHYGSTDAEKLLEILNIPTPGYNFDTFTGMYMAYPGLKSYGLEKLVDGHAPQFSGYKYMIAPYVGPRGVPVPKAAGKTNEALYNYYKNTSLMKCSKCSLQQFVSSETKKSRKQYLCSECGTPLVGAPETSMHFARIPLGVLRLYNNGDADVGKRFEIISRNAASKALHSIYTDMGHLVMRMERNGPLVDYRQIDVLKRIWPPLVAKAGQKLRDLAGDANFNPNNPADIGWLLWVKLKIPYPNPKTKPEDWGTGKEILLQVAQQYPVAAEVIAYRKFAKTMSTYITGYEYCAMLNAGHLRTKWWLTGTKTGRMSSGGSKEKIKGVVNLQNIQKKQEIRNILISDNRWRELHLFLKAMIAAGATDEQLQESVLEKFGDMDVFLEFDQGQVEVRVAAQLSGDKQMIEDCEAGDIHSRVGHAMTGWAIDLIKNDKDTRTRTKNVHFGILFGLQPEGILAYIKGFDPFTKITLDDVRVYYANYFARYPGVQVFIDRQHIFAELHGYVQTIFGMKRPVIINEDVKGLVDDYGQPAYWKNIAVNCYDRATEVLTQNRGWIPGFDLLAGDILLTKNVVTGVAEWQPARAVKKYPDYTGPLIEFSNRSFSAMTTPAHEWLVDQWNSRRGMSKNLVRTSSQIRENNGYKIHRVAEYPGASVKLYDDDFVRLTGWILTDGCKRKRHERPVGHHASVFQSKPHTTKMIDALFERARFPHRRTHSSRGQTVWTMSGWLGKLLRKKFPQRLLTIDFLLELTKSQLIILFDTMMLGDGHTEVSGKQSFYAGRKDSIDIFQTLCALLGRVGSVKYRDMSMYTPRSTKMLNIPKCNGCWSCNIHKRQFTDILKGHKKIHDTSTGGVWCPVVENHTLYVRRKGQPYWSRNTPVQGSAHQLLMCGMVALIRQPEKYKLLGIPQMEVHDNLVMKVKLHNLMECYWLAKELLEQEPLRTVKAEFPHIDWKVKLEVDGAAGFRFGVKAGLNNKSTLVSFLRDWYAENVKSIDALKKLKAEVEELPLAA
jgi:uracil-DNA glycosylase family 4